jgi:hypothetical protein
LGSEQLADFVVTLGRDGWLATAGVGAWLQRAGLGAQLLEVVDGVDSDAEKAGDLGGRADAMFDGVEEALTKFQRVGIHGGRSRGLGVTIEATILIIGFHTDS